MYEHRLQPLLPLRAFLSRLVLHALVAIGIILLSLGIGIAGYHYLEGLSWIDSLLNASMILGGMGPVNPLTTEAGKLFASFYALFSGMVFLVVTGLMFAPIFHRLLHHFHMDQQNS
jgi:hypothetical protein